MNIKELIEKGESEDQAVAFATQKLKVSELFTISKKWRL